MKFLDDIRKQPQGIREIMFGLSVFITVLLIGMIWFRSFQKNLYVLMNPEEDVKKMLARQNFPSENLGELAIENAPVLSLFGFIWRTADDIKGLMLGLLDGNANVMNKHVNDTNNKESGKVYTLPLSEYK